ncbi:MAG: hypothetical protein LBI63_03990 [Candidatus Ancillula sp.]|jgi:aspartate carbamoyltransferase catalytic subunit|nr:hypothetical protein [Candidatus Ancillula sp.]
MQHLLTIGELEKQEIWDILNEAMRIKHGVVRFNDIGVFQNKHILIVGDILHSRVARSNLELLTKLGARVSFVAPGTLLPKDIDDWSVTVNYSLDSALKIADFDAIMMLRIQEERMLGDGFFPTLQEYVLHYGLTNERIATVAKEVPILHPAPINRGLEISSSIADSEKSLINHQIRNGVYTRMAVLKLLINPDATAPDSESLKGITVLNLFFENSTRTRFSFETAEKKLGASVMNFSASGSSVSKGESLKDTVTTLYAMGVDAIVIRHQDSGAAFRLAHSGWIPLPVVNAGDGTHAHPTQALLDALTLREHFSGFSQIYKTADAYGKEVKTT